MSTTINSASFLFGQYFIELSKFFSQFETYNEVAVNPLTPTPSLPTNLRPPGGRPIGPPGSSAAAIVNPVSPQFQTVPKNLNVYYGVPSAAYKRIMKMVNGMPDLPILSFWCADARQKMEMQNPFVRLADKSHIDTSGSTWTVPVTYAPMHWDLTYQISLWTSTYEQRDDLMSKILRKFQGRETAIRYYDDPDDPHRFLWMRIVIDETFTDETELEGAPEKDTRDIIRTSFNITGNAVLPYHETQVPLIRTIQVDFKIKNDEIYDNNHFIRIMTPSLPTDDPIIIEKSDVSIHHI